ncbi:MAG: transposase [Candidatus Njordarchaeales archaeon]
MTLKLDDDDSRVVLIDSTGFQIVDASSYYLWHAQRSADFFKLHVVMNLRTGAILLATPSDRYYHDLKPLRKYFLRELKRLCRRFCFGIKVVSADSACDSEDIYHKIRIELDAIPAIKPAKRQGLPKSGLRVKIRRIGHLLWFKHYVNMRWILEARFKTFKRLFGRVVRGKSEESRSREVLYKALLWNILVLLTRLANGGKRSLNKDEKIII